MVIGELEEPVAKSARDDLAKFVETTGLQYAAGCKLASVHYIAITNPRDPSPDFFRAKIIIDGSEWTFRTRDEEEGLDGIKKVFTKHLESRRKR